MKVKSDFNPSSMMITLTVESGLINKYFANFRGMVMSCKNVPGLEVKQSGKDAIITFPLPADSEKEQSADKSMMIVTLDGNNINSIRSAINRFHRVAVSKELKSVEFFPLEGYSYSKMCEEVKDTVKSHRNILFIKDYDEYLNMEKNRDYKFTQHEVKYGTQEYADCVLMIWKKKKAKINKLYEDKLVFTNWD